MVQKKYSAAEAMYARIKEEVCQRALALDEAVSQSTQVRWGAKEPRATFSQSPGEATRFEMRFYSAVVKPFVGHSVVRPLRGSFLGLSAGCESEGEGVGILT